MTDGHDRTNCKHNGPAARREPRPGKDAGVSIDASSNQKRWYSKNIESSSTRKNKSVPDLMNQKTILISLLALIFLVGGVSGFFAVRNMEEPGWWTLGSSILMSVMIFGWYHNDSTGKSFERSIWLNIGVIGMAPIAVPYYVFRRNGPGTRARAFARLAGYVGLLSITALAGGVAGAIIS
jgi:hypothetical protein